MNPQRDPFAELPIEEEPAPGRRDRSRHASPDRGDVTTLSLIGIATLALIGFGVLGLMASFVARDLLVAAFVMFPIAILFFIPAIHLAAGLVNAILRMGRRG